MQIGLVVLLLLVIGTLHYFFKPQEFNWHVGFTLLIWLALLIILPGNFSDADFRQTAFRTLIIAFVVNLYLNLAFYPSLLKYQAGSEAAFWINQNNAAKLPVARSFEFASFPMEFYLQQPIVELNEDGSGKIPATSFIFYGPAEVAASFTSKGYKVEKLAQFQRFHTSRLTPKFLNQATRDKEVVKMEVVKVFK